MFIASLDTNTLERTVTHDIFWCVLLSVIAD